MDKLPKYLIWYLQGENQEKLITKRIFEEFETKKAWLGRIEKLKVSSTVTRLKYCKTRRIIL